MKRVVALVVVGLMMSAAVQAAHPQLRQQQVRQQPVPAALDEQATNILAQSAIDPATLASRSDRAACGESSDDVEAFGMHGGFSTRPGASSTYVAGGETQAGGVWRGIFWDRRVDVDAPLCAFRAEPEGTGSSLTFHGVRHARAADALTAVEQGNFLCRCTALAR